MRALALASLVAFSACQDETCGFERGVYAASILRPSPNCDQPFPRIVSYAQPPPGCGQRIQYTGCNPTVVIQCDDLELVAVLTYTQTGYVGAVSAHDDTTNLICTADMRLDPL